ncbi:putative U5 snRNP-associated subunit [Toxoplasma gondii TgCatPRC2]|uniref:U5 snRNP-associated subunit, putative n=4 Tax=Toxoplasma gondii TaxID=5811 RepID=S8F2L2_TOXGM|nr:U5 snRNP-associated subunit, putative [Toxoplasma gondii ME49]EPT29991.1 U5 snRNP-associated subunit, putative [Toxoplasma gondii ME49]KYF44418.1 putative U5 snRNP-associated subunit [Toxoplasma gondii ARI]KYK66325.1 putative U5 snRNP-associated subunit [Toxoplasma gondii TgCatPRC2]PIM02419.1 putative U5 snRNP-associated subunit [Toxoplasma gondii COUG]|eukprot:XP_018637285.1 U5 snRNP-associated subunit, putative [Toxoplasma gondii ME49]
MQAPRQPASLMPGARRFMPGVGSGPSGPYVAGVGRGATPFSTRAETPGLHSVPGRRTDNLMNKAALQASAGVMVGGELSSSARTAAELFGRPPPGYIPGRGRGATGFAGGVSRDDTATDNVHDKSDLSDANFDPFTGYSEALFNDAEYDEEDKEADRIYDTVDMRMDARRKSRRENRLKEEIAKMRAEKPTIHQQFADLKRSLATVTKEEWEAIPSVGDYTLKRKQKKPQMFSMAPDSLLLQGRNSTSYSNSIASAGSATPIGFGMQTPLMGMATPLGLQTPLGLRTPLLGSGSGTGSSGAGTPSLNDLGEARGTVLSVKLDKVMDNLSGQTVIDPKGYLTDLNSMQLQSDADVADIKKARTLLKSVTATNPHHAPGWIAAARLEELAGKLQAARELIATGCQQCPKSEDVWLEAARLEKPANAKAVLAKAVSVLPHSVRLWFDAYAREKDLDQRKRVLRKALEFIPNSVRLWKEAVSLEEEKNARIMLTRAVECVPQSVEIWLALARLSSYEEAQKVLNEARKKCPTSPEIWVAACKLEETQGNLKMVDTIIARARDNLIARGVAQTRDVWLRLAEEAEASGFMATCQAIVRATMKVGVEGMNAKRIWKEDAEEALSRGSVATARALYTCAIERLKTKKSLWLALADLETKHGTTQDLEKLLAKAVVCCPQAEVLWLMLAKQHWLQGDVQAARKVLAEAFVHNENNEAISLAAVKLERENHEFARARKILKRTRAHVNTQKVWIQSVQLERQVGDYDAAIALCEEALKSHAECPKLWMIGGQLHREHPTKKDEEKAAEVFQRGTVVCCRSVPLWLCAVDCQREQGKWSVARAILEKAKLRNPKNPDLWHAAIRIEVEAGNKQMAQHVASKAVQECPNSGLVWAEAIFLEEKSAQTHKAVDALTKCENDVHLVLAVACLFWKEGKISKARKWLNRSVTLDASFGDAWAAFLAFELENGGGEKECRNIINKASLAQPNRGLNWNKVVKHVSCWTLSFPEKLRKVVERMFPEVMKNDKLPQVIKDALYGKLDISVAKSTSSLPQKGGRTPDQIKDEKASEGRKREQGDSSPTQQGASDAKAAAVDYRDERPSTQREKREREDREKESERETKKAK